MGHAPHGRIGSARRIHLAILAAIGSLALIASQSPALAAAGTAYVRVNQVGYPAANAKRAYLLSSADEAGATFAVKDAAGATAFSGPIGANLGSWSTAFPFVYALDFDPVMSPGTYTVSVTGPVSATSPSFRIDAPAALYASPLANALAFYQTERDGPNFIASSLRTAAAHLNDRTAMTYLSPHVNSAGRFSGDLTPLGKTIDASGGWWDAGDYIKGVETISYTTDLLLAGVRDFPAQMGSGSASNFSGEARFGTTWLLRMWNDATRTLYYQVGIGNGNAKTIGDHDIWRLPQADDTYGGTDPLFRYIRHRPVFRAGPPGSAISPNLAGRDAAAFALCFQVFKKSNPTLAARCLLSAEHIFDLANTAPSGDLTTFLPFSFYPETEWRSDLELGAVELYFAVAGGGLPAGLPHTDPAFYLQRAAHWANAYMASPDDAADTLNLYDVSGLAHYDVYRAIAKAGKPSGLEVTQSALVADMKKALDRALAQAATDPFGFGFPWDTWDTTSHGAGLSVMASEYDQLTGTNSYGNVAGRWLANILGANAWGSSLIIGDGTTFPHCPHHQVANLAGHLDGTPPRLNGAAVEGPNGTLFTGFLTGMNNCPPDDSDPFAQFNGKTAKFKDDIESFSTVEPAVDLTASSPLAFAWQTVPVPTGVPAGPQTVVSIQFDDGNADQYQALAMLTAHGMHGTFYVNSGFIGDADKMTWAQLQDLSGAGNEIAGHTIHHVGLKSLKTADARLEVCGDRVALFDHGFQPTSFAYPFGTFDSGTEQVVHDCGYNSGRGVSGVDDTKTFAETIPPLDPYATRTPPNVKSGTTLDTIEGFVTAAEQHGGGWVQLVFHHICDHCDAYSVTAADFVALLDWLQPRTANGTVVETTAQVIGGPVNPPVAPSARYRPGPVRRVSPRLVKTKTCQL
jgi:endoglucanase